MSLHCEKHNVGMLVDGNPGVNLFSLDGSNGMVTGWQILSTANTNVRADWIRENNPAQKVIINPVSACALTLSANNPPTAGGVITDFRFSIGGAGGCKEWWDIYGRHWPECSDYRFSNHEFSHQRQCDSHRDDCERPLPITNSNQCQRGLKYRHNLCKCQDYEPD